MNLLRQALDAVDDPAATRRIDALFFRKPCTGLTARWCPNHGVCGCVPDGHMSAGGCPLHAPHSDHPHSEETP